MKTKKILLLAIPMLALTSSVTAVAMLEPQPIVVKAEEVAEEQPAEESKFENFKNTYLVPLLSGVTVASVLSMALSIGLAVYNSKVNKKTRTLVKGCIEQILSTLKVLNALVSEFEQSNRLSKATLKLIDESFQKLLAQLSLLEKATKKTEELKEAVVLIGQMQKELAKVDRQAVSSGVAKTLVQLEAILKTIG